MPYDMEGRWVDEPQSAMGSLAAGPWSESPQPAVYQSPTRYIPPTQVPPLQPESPGPDQPTMPPNTDRRPYDTPPGGIITPPRGPGPRGSLTPDQYAELRSTPGAYYSGGEDVPDGPIDDDRGDFIGNPPTVETPTSQEPDDWRSGWRNRTYASLDTGDTGGTVSDGNVDISGTADTFNDRFGVFGGNRFNTYQQPTQAEDQRQWWLDNPGETVIGDPPPSTSYGLNRQFRGIGGSNTPPAEVRDPRNYGNTPYGQTPTTIDTYQGDPHRFDPTAPANTFDSRFNAVDPAVDLGVVDSFNSRWGTTPADTFADRFTGGDTFSDRWGDMSSSPTPSIDWSSRDMSSEGSIDSGTSGLNIPGSMSYNPRTNPGYAPTPDMIVPGGWQRNSTGNLVPAQPSYQNFGPTSNWVPEFIGSNWV